MKKPIIIGVALIASGFLFGLQGTLVLIGLAGIIWVLYDMATRGLGVK